MTSSHPFDRRRAGVLCAVSSLPGSYDRGTLGDAAIRFLDFIEQAGLRVWQVLPLNPPDRHGSPYHSTSAFAMDALLTADLSADEVQDHARRNRSEFEAFRAESAFWLPDFAAFEAVARERSAAWPDWPKALRDREPDALSRLHGERAAAIEAIIEAQFVVFSRWQALHREAAARDVLLFGDVPLYPAHGSADVWAHRSLFQLDANGEPLAVAGVPPDYFSVDGQRWGNPLYDWGRLATTEFGWWRERMATQLALFDVVRLDHFRGLEAYWSIPRGADARSGAWVPGPGRDLLEALRHRFGRLPLVAEDLGIITPAVDALRTAFDLPGMRVLQFAFSGAPDNPHLPSQHREDCVVYTGTHDNDTTLGWYGGLDEHTRAAVDARLRGLGKPPWSMIALALDSIARTAIVPLQDFLELGSAARMNTPGTISGNWAWRFGERATSRDLAKRIRAEVERSGRAA